jgi:hypothetical protein
MSASTRHEVAPMVALILSFVTVFVAGQLMFVPKEIKGEIEGTFDLGTVQPDTTFEGPVLRADVVPMGGGKYRICVTPPQGTTVEGGDWSTNGDHRGGQYCRDLNPGEDVKVVVKP